ncbi:hypothetical protein [Stenotrophomonas maltophilia]|uniref:hypothetical protein n=1 Tax=Stenotrophomonas maltophilia TaxID=40324 RepID=UPI0006AC6803|nr:hypothetical protein [Stenotrophomonas maltophilia]KOQ73213.1 hypothetical protein ABW44_12990 [Stenotrophomonas maltophilia]HEL4298249.1 hypothetical protein [Stenotrophomonas maltophilia]
MKLQVAILMFIVSASAQAADGVPADKQAADEAKAPARIVRSAEWPDFIGGTVSVEQSLTRNSKGQYVYRYDDQSEATKQYHEASCADIGMNPAKGESITVGAGSAAWHCSSIESSNVSDAKSTDYVIAYAPNGQVSAGQNFVSYGTVRFNSSVSGNIQGSAQIDNGRCQTFYSEHYPPNTVGNHTARVLCFAHSAQTMNTLMEGCVPRACASDRGSIIAN